MYVYTYVLRQNMGKLTYIYKYVYPLCPKPGDFEDGSLYMSIVSPYMSKYMCVY